MKAVIRTECLPKEQRTAIRRACKDEMKNQNRRLLKLVCIALHEEYGFGRERLYKLVEKIAEISNSRMDHPVYWQHNDKFLTETLKMAWDIENYEEMGE